MSQFVIKHYDEDDTADNTCHKLDRDFVRGDYRSCYHIAHKDEKCAEKPCINECAADFIPFEHRNYIWHDKTDIGNLPHNDDYARRYDSGYRKPHYQYEAVIHTEIFRKILPHTHDIEVVCIDKHKNYKRKHKIYKLIISLDYQGEGAGKICGKLLVYLPLEGEEVCHTAYDIAEHNADERHKHCVLDLDFLYEEYEKQSADDSKSKGEERSDAQPHCWEEYH